jgi:AcrR family transcriptional regulator
MSTHRKRPPTADHPVRKRRSAQEAKAETLSVARRILLERGPDAVTLKNIAAEIGTTHTNLLHHFGTAGEQQSALMLAMVNDLSAALGNTIARLDRREDVPRALVDTMFDAFDQGGAGRLAAWIALSNRLAHFDEVKSAVQNLVGAIEEKFGNGDGEARDEIAAAVLFVALLAFGNAVIGQPLAAMLAREPEAVRGLAERLLPQFL